MWQVEFTSKSIKQFKKMPSKVQKIVALLVADIKANGPVRYNWPNFSKLEENTYHCHVKKGRPTYVVCWAVANKQLEIVEIYYVGSHENAPY